MTTAIVSVDGGEPAIIEAEVLLPEGGAAEEIAEAIEEVSSDAVEIARIEADKDITVAAITADAEVALAEVHADERREEREIIEERNEAWQGDERLMTLETNLQELAGRVETLLSALPLTPQPSAELATEIAAEVAEVEAEAEATTSTLPFISPATSETKTEVTVKNEGENPEAEVRVTRKRRWI